MFTRTKSFITIVVLAAGVSVSCAGGGSAKKDGETSPAATSSTPQPLPAGVTQNLNKNSAPPAYNFDNLGPIGYPAVQKAVLLSVDADNIVSGWALDPSNKALAGGVDVVLDQVPHAASYGTARQDVADHFKSPALLNCGFQLMLVHGQLSKGPHTVSVRVIASDQKSYNEGPVVQFTVN